jgi:hypothetical protein
MPTTKPYPNIAQEAREWARTDMFRREIQVGLKSGNGCANRSPQREAGS